MLCNKMSLRSGYDRTAIAGSKKTKRLESAAGGATTRCVSNLPLPLGKRKTAHAGEVSGQGRSCLRIIRGAAARNIGPGSVLGGRRRQARLRTGGARLSRSVTSQI